LGVLGERNTARATGQRAIGATAMRSFGLAGATVIMPSGDAISDCDSSHPASIVSASGKDIRGSCRRPKPSTTTRRQWKAPLWQALTEAAFSVAEDCTLGASLAEDSACERGRTFAMRVPLARNDAGGMAASQSEIASPEA